ncbi:LacI family DNA-binding transcriptional regulator [Alteripontixanthobacter maritimus]|nr:LacI family DNA-binding transcriptional regulator [Alteripontixanthobacter maritimus]
MTQSPRKRPTSFDVAHLAGVSQSTVSRALAGSPSITEATRNRVMAAAAELDYLVDERAARLRRGTTSTLAVVVLRRPEDTVRSANPFYQELLYSVCEAAATRQLDTLVSLQSDDGDLSGRYVEQGQADGLVVIGSPTNVRAWEYFHELEADTSYDSPDTIGHAAYWGTPHEDMRWVRADNATGGRLAVRHLTDAGYRSIAYAGSDGNVQQQFRERHEGYLAEMADRGLAPRMIAVDQDSSREDQGRAAADAVLAAGDVDAMFVACDRMALGVLDRLSGLGTNVPGDIGVVGFDGMGAGRFSNPPLSTIEPDLAAAGKMLVDAAIDGVAQADGVRVPVRYVARSSVRSE